MHARKATPLLGSGHADFLAPVLALGEGPRSRVGWTLAIVGALAIHASFAAQRFALLLDIQRYAEGVRIAVAAELRTYISVESQPEPPPPPPPPPEPEPAPEPVPQPKAVPAPATRAESEPPPPAAAQAGKVLTADPDPNEPVDLTGDGFVTGTGTAYAGGTTSSAGTSKTAVYDPRARGAASTPALPGTETRPGSTNLSRPARPLSDKWDDCGFPPEADVEQINHAKVSIAVTVSPDGTAKSVAVLRDPGYGFGHLARRCASRRRFQPALDASGRAVTSTTQPFTILFTR